MFNKSVPTSAGFSRLKVGYTISPFFLGGDLVPSPLVVSLEPFSFFSFFSSFFTLLLVYAASKGKQHQSHTKWQVIIAHHDKIKLVRDISIH